MTTTIGRASLSTSPFTLSHSGDFLTFGINIHPDTLVEAQVIRQQLTGLMPDDVIPVTWSLDSNLDGFYRVVAPLTVSPLITYLNSGVGFMRAGVSLQRVGGGYSAPLIEVAAESAWRETGGVATNGSLWIPSPGTVVTPMNKERETETGTVFGRNIAGSYPSFSFTAGPEDYFNGAATVEYKVAGSWHVAVGRQIPTLSSLSDLRVSNGLVRASMATGGVLLEAWDDPDWVDIGTFQLRRPALSVFYEPLGSPTILSNGDPSNVSIRLQVKDDGEYPTVGDVVLHLRRGSKAVEMAFTVAGGLLGTGAAIIGDAAAADETLTGGFQRTTNDANGNRYAVWGYGETVATPSAVGQVTGVDTVTAGLSPLLDFDSMSAGDIDDVRADYDRAVSQRQRVVN